MSQYRPPPVRAGALRQYADIEQRTKTGTGDRGQPILSDWQPLYQGVPLEIVPLTGRLLEITRQLVPMASHQITLRWRTGLQAGQTRVNYQGRYFNVGYVNDGDFRKRWLVLTVIEQQGGAM